MFNLLVNLISNRIEFAHLTKNLKLFLDLSVFNTNC